MHKRKTLAAAAAFIAAAVTGSAATAEDYWTGGYGGIMGGRGMGAATYVFNTNGFYNDNAGETFTEPVAGLPLGGFMGYNWTRDRLVYGLEYSIYSAFAGISHWHVLSPYNPNQHFDLKGHWFTTLTGRIGITAGRLLAYVEGGAALAHLVAGVDDTANDYFIWGPHSVLGLVVGAGVSVAVTPNLSFGVGYQFATFLPAHVSGQSLMMGSGNPAGPGTETDHTIQYRLHTIMARVTFRIPPADELAAAPGSWTGLDWAGFYAGPFAGALHQIGVAAGYNLLLGQRMLAGIDGQLALAFCCGRDVEVDVNGRVGAFLGEDVLVYGEVGLGYLAGTFFDILGGAYYTAGGGVEIAMSRRLSTYMEVKGVGGFGRGFLDANFQGGVNVHF